MSTQFAFAWRALAAHFGPEQINRIVSSRREFGAHLRPDVQSAINEQLAPFETTLLGLHQYEAWDPLTFSRLLVRGERHQIPVTALQYQDVDVGEAKPFAVLNNGLWLFRVENRPVAVLVSQYTVPLMGKFTQVEIATLDEPTSVEFARNFLAAVQAAGATSALYRGKMLSFEEETDYSGVRAATMRVHKLPAVPREAVILDEATMARLDRGIFKFVRHREALKQLGQSTRKGLLLYGPTGNGKSLIIRYIASNLPEHTTLLITGDQVGDLLSYMRIARTLQPSIVVLEDMDLIGRTREDMNSPKTEVLLNTLLNEVDGQRDDADLLFILTTNRVEDIEKALACRPGRVDEAIEIANPDSACRARLIALYGDGLVFEDGAVDEFVQRSEGESASSVRVTVRRLAQAALASGNGTRISRELVARVLGEATDPGSRIVALFDTASGG
ncbi:AAA family ATPase [Methylobacterium sp. WSM2598]|uniref:AAA family ATPase n=1 Tax=Methylobacterium sp. WSM2598 TaxID=398261 RepID=UPI00037D5072|nr:ATP-binding protein [Methylobacterium sp. WSM2598]